MTLQKAIKIRDWWIEQKKHRVERLKKEWKFADDIHDVGKILLDVDETIISNLEIIRKELVPKCNHPEKMQDTDPDGNRYCMNCNWDL